MKQSVFQQLETYMHTCMQDSAHDKEHVYRVLYTAMDLAAYEAHVDMDVLLAACLLHDIGRQEQYREPSVCHAACGAEKARTYLLEQGFSPDFADHVAACILTHRFRKAAPPVSIEAKILFDADKLDVTGTIGIARTLQYNGKMDEPLYSLDESGHVSDGNSDLQPSFLQEYHFKLQKLYDRFYTARGAALAAQRHAAAEHFYLHLLQEARASYEQKEHLFADILEKSE